MFTSVDTHRHTHTEMCGTKILTIKSIVKLILNVQLNDKYDIYDINDYKYAHKDSII